MSTNIIKLPRVKSLSIIVLITIGISLTSCSRYGKSEESLTYLNAPEEGDVYFIEQEKDVFTLLKAKSISGDTIDFLVNKYKNTPGAYMDESYGSIKFVRTEELNEEPFWSDSIVTYNKEEVKKLYDNNVIFEIKRY